MALTTALISLAVGPSLSRDRKACGRPLGQRVVYTSVLSNAKFFTIASARKSSGQFMVRINGPNAQGRLTGWASSDEGTNWSSAEPSPGWIQSTWSEYWASRSDRSIAYTAPGTVFKRSYDGGHSWHTLDKPRVNGLSWAEFCKSPLGKEECASSFSLVAIDPSAPLTVYAALSASSPIYVSHDGGDSWTTFSAQIWGNEPMGISPIDPRIIYAVELLPADGARVIVKSIDAGKHWHPVPQQKTLNETIHWKGETPATRRHMMRVRPFYIDVIQWVFDPTHKNIVYLVANKGVYRTIDGGRTWRLLDFGYDAWQGVTTLVLGPFDPRKMLISTFIGVFRSDDGGCHFVNITPADAWHYSPSELRELGYRPIAPVLHPAPPSNPHPPPIPGPRARKRPQGKKSGAKVLPPEVRSAGSSPAFFDSQRNR